MVKIRVTYADPHESEDYFEGNFSRDGKTFNFSKKGKEEISGILTIENTQEVTILKDDNSMDIWRQ